MRREHEQTIRALRGEQDRIRRLVERVDSRIDDLAAKLESAPFPMAPIFEPQLPPQEAPVPVIAPPSPIISAAVAAQAPEPSAPPVSRAPEPASLPQTPSESFEITFGRVWLARIGIVILLTGLVFLGNLAYQHIVPRLGPGAKLLAICMAGGALGGIGAWLERKHEGMRNYARVLIAGACATIYYAAYAAHFVNALRVIESPIVGGVLLLGLAGGVAWIAHRRKSEALAVLSVLLSYYTSGLNPIGGFTLFSSLLLTVTAVFFLLKNRWVKLTFVSLGGTYLSYAWTRYYAMPLPAGTLLTQMLFLGGYWLLFTAGGLLVRSKGVRLPFLTANNGAFFALAAWELLQADSPDFWLLSLSLGAVILGLSVLARRMHPDERALDSGLFVQGIALTTLGLATRLSGQQLALTLAAQSVVLLFSGERQRQLRAAASLLSIAGAAFLALQGLIADVPHSAFTAGAVSLVLCVDAWIFRRRSGESFADRVEPVAQILTLAAAALSVGWIACSTEPVDACAWLSLGAILCALLPLVFRFRELTFAGQTFHPIAVLLWMACALAGAQVPARIPAILIASGIGLSVWWARQNRVSLGARFRSFLEASPAFFASAAACWWMMARLDSQEWMLCASAIGPVWIVLALLLRAPMLSLSGLAFTALSVSGFFAQQQTLAWWFGLAPIVHVLIVAGLSRFGRRDGKDLMPMAASIWPVALAVAVVMTFFWIFAHIPALWQALFFACVGAAGSLAGAARNARELSIAGVILGAIGWALAVFNFQTVPAWQQLAAVIVFPAGCRAARKIWSDDPTHEITRQLSWATMIGITVWVLRWTNAHDLLKSLTILCTLLGLGYSAMGLVLRDREYRLGGLILLGLSVARVFLVDVWAFNPVFRILTFILLGVVLLLVGYFYNRFAEKLKSWI